jgi:outer membrane protein assembly factor BamD (BamD/ComL family)
LAKAIYALGSYYLTLDDKNKADSLFKFVYENYRSDPIAKNAAIRLGINIEEVNSDPALEKYRIAEEFLDSEKYFDAIEQLKYIYTEFPESPYSSKALYSIGWIYENKLHDYDGAVVYYDSLKTKYSQTEYVREISPKLAFYHSEKKAVQDSIARAETAIKDSINRAEKAKSSAIVADSLSNINSDLKTIKVNSDSTQIFADSLKSVIDSTKIPLNLEKNINQLDNGKDSTSTLTPFKPTSEAENKNKK